MIYPAYVSKWLNWHYSIDFEGLPVFVIVNIALTVTGTYFFTSVPQGIKKTIYLIYLKD
jgi:hypothetical protein